MHSPASMIGREPVQRHRLPDKAVSTSSRVGAARCKYSANSDITKPGVQKPHCDPWQSTSARCTGCSVPSGACRLSTVTSSLPSRVGRKRMQELIARYLICRASGDSSPSTTVHAPQSPSAHPSLVPVRPARLRRYSSTVVAGGTSETQMSSPSSMNRVACVSGRTLLTTRGSRSGCASATAVSGIAPWRYQERHVIVLLRACDPECNDYDVDERWLGQLQPP